MAVTQTSNNFATIETTRISKLTVSCESGMRNSSLRILTNLGWVNDGWVQRLEVAVYITRGQQIGSGINRRRDTVIDLWVPSWKALSDQTVIQANKRGPESVAAI
jgi:hypothetical protein